MKYILLVFLIFPLATFAQNDDVIVLSKKNARTTRFANGWIALDSGWKFKAGDNPDWAKPDFDDQSWQSMKLFQELYDLPQIPSTGIIWFRLRVTVDSSLLNEELVMRIYQTGASEIYLDGKRIHQLGTVSTNPDSVNYYSPNFSNLSFPLVSGKASTIAIRFANLPNRFPIYFNSLKSNLEPWVSTLDNANDDYITRYYRINTNRTHIGIGVAAVLCILYLSLFLFFPAQKVNLYFSLSSFFFALFLYFISKTEHGSPFRYDIPLMVFVVAYLLMFLYSLSKTFNQKPGWIFRTLVIAGIIAVPGVFIVNASVISTFLAIFVLIEVMRICVSAIRNNNSGAWIIVISVAIDLVYWLLNLVTALAGINIPGIDLLLPFAYLIGPVSLAIYLGYSFGMTSLSLRQNLAEVQRLSAEKEEILSNQNELLTKQVAERTAELNQSLQHLKSTQSQLIQSEKMASLGELTAGIAHEIQNPLNFVNNFSEVSGEMIVEAKGKRQKAKENSPEVAELLDDIELNLEKINHHGKRADAIVKGMLQHSRTTTGQRESTDLNALVDEYIKLAFHAYRGKDSSLSAGQAGFDVKLISELDPTIGEINIAPHEIGRVLLNILNNAFYAVSVRLSAVGRDNRSVVSTDIVPATDTSTFANATADRYQPQVSITTKKNGNQVVITVKDNGIGIPEKILDKVFQPFFTTKPTGQGIGLGLSLAYDIVKTHLGEIKVKSTEGLGTEFIILLNAHT